MKRKTKNWLKGNIFNLIFLVILIGLIGYVIYGSETGTLQSILGGLFTIKLEQDDITNLNNNPSGSCSFAIPSSACVGDLVTSTLSDGKNGFCRIGYKYNSGEWQFYKDVNTDSNGKATVSDSAEIPGSYLFGAYCIDENGKLCRTNDDTIQINDCEETLTCTDSDGGKYEDIPGHVTIGDDSIYDVCTSDNLGVIEYYCDDGVLAGETISCLPGACTTTRSGGMCSETSAGGWEEGDIVYSNSGESGISGGTITIKYIDLEDYGFTAGGSCHPAVQLHTYWDYQDAQACFGYVTQQGVKWSFYDSSRPNPRWTRTDLTPPSNLVETIYPVSWDGTNPWHLDVGLTQQIPGCNVQYHWEIKVFIAECD